MWASKTEDQVVAGELTVDITLKLTSKNKPVISISRIVNVSNPRYIYNVLDRNNNFKQKIKFGIQTDRNIGRLA